MIRLSNVTAYPFDDFLHATLLRVFQRSLWLILSNAQCTREKLERPLIDSNQEDAIVQPVPIICDQQVDIRELWLGRYKHVERDLRVHEHRITVVPHKPLQPLAFGFGKLFADDGHDPAVFRPQSADHMFAEDVVRISMEFIV